MKKLLYAAVILLTASFLGGCTLTPEPSPSPSPSSPSEVVGPNASGIQLAVYKDWEECRSVNPWNGYGRAMRPSGDLLGTYTKDGYMGFIAGDGAPTDSIDLSSNILYAGDYQNGLVLCQGMNNRMGYVDITGHFYIPPVFKVAYAFTPEGYALVQTPDDAWHILDLKGNFVGDSYASAEFYRNDFWGSSSDSCFVVQKAADGPRILLDKHLKTGIQEFDEVREYSRRYLVYKRSGRYGVYDIGDQTVLLPPDYNAIQIMWGNTSRHAMMLLKDTQGSYYYDPAENKRYDYLPAEIARDFAFNGHIAQQTENEVVLIDYNGNILLRADYIYEEAPGLYIYTIYESDNYKRGIANSKGEILLEPQNNANVSYLSPEKLLIEDNSAPSDANKDSRYTILNIATRERTILDGARYYVINPSFTYETGRPRYMVYSFDDAFYGMMDADGNVLLEPVYESIFPIGDLDPELWDNANGPIEDQLLFGVTQKACQGAVDIHGNIVIPMEYESIYADNFFLVALDKLDSHVRHYYFRQNQSAAEPQNRIRESSAYSADALSTEYIPTVHMRPDTQLSLVDGAHTLWSLAAPYWQGDVLYADLGHIWGVGNLYGTDYWGGEYQFAYPQGRLHFKPGSNIVDQYVYNPTERCFEIKEITMDAPFAMALHGGNYSPGIPVAFTTEQIGLSYDENAAENLYTITQKPAVYTADEAARIAAAFTEYRSITDLPRENGSTATYPFALALYSHLTGISTKQLSEGWMNHDKTAYAFESLINGTSDIIFIADPPSADALSMGAWNIPKVDMTAFSQDGFIFFVNADNPVDSLTIEQIQDIYQGKITNWSQVGGRDEPIIPYQRNADSGSQTLMLDLVMKDKPIMEPDQTHLISAMGTIIDQVAEYDNSTGSIGYSLYNYADSMYVNGNIKMLAINGIAPSVESITGNQYPLIFQQYAIVLADNPPGSPERQMIDLIHSDEGKAIIESCGLIPVP